MQKLDQPIEPSYAASALMSIGAEPPEPLNGDVLCEWHRWCHGNDPGKGVYRDTPATYHGTWQIPESDSYEERRYRAASPDQIADCLEQAFSAFEGYAREPVRIDGIHRTISAQTLAWLVSRLIRAWPFDTYNETVALLAFGAATVRLGFTLYPLPHERLDVRQAIAYSIVPRSKQPPSIDFFAEHLRENLKPIEPNVSADAEGFAQALTTSHRMFSRESAEVDAAQMTSKKLQLAGASKHFLTGGDSRTGRRTRHLMRRRKRSG